MRKTLSYSIIDTNFLSKALQWASGFDVACLLNSSGFTNDQFSKTHIDGILAVGVRQEITPTSHCFDALQQFCDEQQDWLFGFLNYDLKTELEGLSSENVDSIEFPLMHFFSPKHLLEFNGDRLLFHYYAEDASKEDIDEIVKLINAYVIAREERPKQSLHNGVERADCFGRSSLAMTSGHSTIDFKASVEKEDYKHTVNHIKQHVQQGDVYEMCYCMEFLAKEVSINPHQLYASLNEVSPTPFSCYYKLHDKYLLSASPERFLKKEGNKIFSQPIKGTAPRNVDAEKDLLNKKNLIQSNKEQAENVMIVDLVRNDLSVIAKSGTVKVDELFGIYSFPQVHQMISTVSCEVDEQLSITDIIKPMFPMGSMTGAPKIRAMQLAEQYETSRRGLYSGAVGYIKPNGDFDFNVVIRSLQYNQSLQHLSFMVGSAITANSDAEQEYNECLVKAKAMLKAVKVYENR